MGLCKRWSFYECYDIDHHKGDPMYKDPVPATDDQITRCELVHLLQRVKYDKRFAE